MQRSGPGFLLSLAVSCSLCGCGTIMDLAGRTHEGNMPDHSSVYGGVQEDVHVGSALCRQIGGAEEFHWGSPLAVIYATIDTPISFVFDTLLLPCTATGQVMERKDWEKQQRNPPAEDAPRQH